MQRRASGEGPAFHPTTATASAWRGDCLALVRLDGPTEADGELRALDARLGGTLGRLVADTGFTAAPEQVAVARAPDDGPVSWVVLVGLGRRETLQVDDVRRAGAALAWALKGPGPRAARRLGVHLDAGVRGDGALAALVEGFMLAIHEGQWFILPQRFKSEPDEATRDYSVTEVELLEAAGSAAAVERGRAVTDGILLSRELVAAPPNLIGPVELADVAADISAGHGLALEILGRAECEREGLGAFLAATRASQAPPQLIHLAYRPVGRPRRRLAVVGLGITHDPDGLAVHGRVDGMKRHKGAASSALGAAQALGVLRPDVEAHFVLPVGDKGGLRPGDLVTAGNGTTIEVNGAGAEGRLMLADALVFAERLGVDAILDVATLTQGCVQALGPAIAGLWASHDALADEVAAAAAAAGEQVWRLPLHAPYRRLLWPPFADARSSGPPEADALTAALFLRGFVERTPWAHLDIAGPVWSPRVDGYWNAGATGFGVGTLVNWLCAP